MLYEGGASVRGPLQRRCKSSTQSISKEEEKGGASLRGDLQSSTKEEKRVEEGGEKSGREK